ncbi:MAG: DUF917 domain-containing protein [Candidatus Bipolaricaulia bacterium]
MTRVLHRQELRDLLLGAAILGTGGGGSLKQGLEFTEEDLAAGRRFQLMSLSELPDDALIASPYVCGSISPEEGKGSRSDPTIAACVTAFQELATYLNEKFSGVVATEIGGGNTAIALSVSARADVPIIDADPAGRSVPELQHSTFCIHQVLIAPLAVVTPAGVVVIIKKVTDDSQAEKIARDLAVASGGQAGVTDHPARGAILKNSLIPGTLSTALEIGQSVRQARASGSDPVQAALDAGSGYLLFRGTLTQADWEIRAGFTVGQLTVQGGTGYEGHRYEIWYKNEHIISWFDGEVDITAPDLICVLEAETGQPIINPNAQEEMQVAVIGYRAPDMWRSEEGLRLFGPKHFGYDIDYRVIEENSRLGSSQ